MEEEQEQTTHYSDRFKVQCQHCRNLVSLFGIKRAYHRPMQLQVFLCQKCFDESPEFVLEMLPYLQPEDLSYVYPN